MACEKKPSADGTRFAYVKQTDCETIPNNPEFQIIGITAESLSGNIGTADSAEIYADRNRRDTVRVSSDVGGDVSVEWRVKALSELIIAGLQSNGVESFNKTGDLTVVGSTGAISCPTDFFDGMKAGYFFKLGGFTNPTNNVVVRVISITDAQNAIVAPAFGGSLADATQVGATGNMFRYVNGQTPRHYCIEKKFTDMTVPAIFRYKGAQVSTLNFTFGSQSILTGSVGFIGLSEEVTTTELSGATYLAPSADPILDTTTAVGDLWFDDTLTTYDVMELSIDLNNNSRGQTAIGSDGFVGIAHGKCDVSGNISTYFESIDQYNRFLNQERINIDLPLEDSEQNEMVFSMSSVKHQDMTVNATGENSDVMASGGYRAHINADAVETVAVTWFVDPQA